MRGYLLVQRLVPAFAALLAWRWYEQCFLLVVVVGVTFDVAVVGASVEASFQMAWTWLVAAGTAAAVVAASFASAAASLRPWLPEASSHTEAFEAAWMLPVAFADLALGLAAVVVAAAVASRLALELAFH